ncbi:hypothetical protein DRO37_09160 [Candidatus Bathyarchaeota archaeon]|nr:MAG: hypothetical protein DRO37_09160 [Candidatus Bathyarchaeota archaeon]
MVRYIRFPYLRAVGVSSLKFEDVADSIRLFKVMKRMEQAKILVLAHRERKTCVFAKDLQKCIDAVKDIFGTEVVRMDKERFLDEYYANAPSDEAEKVADMWIKEAMKVVEPTKEQIITVAKIYLAMKKAMKDVGAEVITTDIMGHYYHKLPPNGFKAYWPNRDPMNRGTYRGLPEFPCLAFAQLDAEGLRGVCEFDLDASVTSLLVKYLAEETLGYPIPGFTSEPIFDFGNGWAIYCHCKATFKPLGPKAPKNPFMIRSHGESGVSVSVQSFLPLNRKVTVARVDLLNKTLRIHQGIAVANTETITAERACRTKLAIKTNLETLFNNYYKGTSDWHRTVFYGDWREPLIALATLYGLDVFEEDKP